MSTYAVQLLQSARVNAKPFAGTSGVLLSPANQLFGTYKDLKGYQRSQGGKNYFGWHAHHIVEKQDLDRLAVSHRFPPDEDQLCVLLPERAHIGRVSSVLRNQAAMGIQMLATELRGAYFSSYSMIGDYCGGGETAIRRELMAIVNATFKRAGF